MIYARSLFNQSAQSVNFTSETIPFSGLLNASIVAKVSNSVSLTSVAKVEASINGVDWFTLTGTEQQMTVNDNYAWVLSDLGSINLLRLSVTISAGSATFEVTSSP